MDSKIGRTRDSSRNVGVSLAFLMRGPDTLHARMNSYAIAAASRVELLVVCELIAAREMVSAPDAGIEYVGIADVFGISCLEVDGMLGRTSREEWQSIDDVRKHTRNPGAYTIDSQRPTGDLCLARLLYLCRSPRTGSHGVEVLCLINGSTCRDAAENALLTAETPEFLAKVVACTKPAERVEVLAFVGIGDIAAVFENPFEGGAFERLERRIDDPSELEDELLHEDDLAAFFDDRCG